MDIPVAAAPWIVLGAVLGIAVVAAAGLSAWWLLRGRGDQHRDHPASPTAPAGPHDDLVAFLESPPGSVDDPRPPAAGWATLAPASPASVRVPAPERAEPHRSGTAAVLLATLGIVLLVGVAAALGIVSEPERGRTSEQAEGSPDDVAAELTFGGVILERRPVGVTATYPRLRLTTERGRTVAEVELPAYNCLTAEAPEDPVAAGCVPAGTERAELASPALTVTTAEDGEVRIAGRFSTRVQHNGRASTPTGSSYAIEVTAEPVGKVGRGEWLPATGTLRLGDDAAASSGGDGDRIRFG